MKNIGGEAACIKIPQGRHQVFLDCETERELVANYILNFLNL
jgi:alpha-beta hydrolase superfamily lysophospholipase